MAPQDFQDQLTDFLPRMRVWALALTRNRSAADDLVQEVALKTLLANETFTPGTNFPAWVHRIMMNSFISGKRMRVWETIYDAREMTAPPTQQDSLYLEEADLFFQRLPVKQKSAFRSVVFDERSYEDVADETGCSIGTLKSRVHRARRTLRSDMFGTTTDSRVKPSAIVDLTPCVKSPL